MPLTVPEDVLFQYRRFSLYNSPFVAHDRGCAIDLYPDEEWAPSPVSGEVVDVKRVEAPPRAYAADHDYLVLVDTGEYVARMLHVEPAVEPGDAVAVGDDLGTLVRAGFFAPWVPNHIHLGFREYDADPYRANGSLPIGVEVGVEPRPWDGTGTVVETGDTWVRLDRPVHPAPGERFVGLAAEIDTDGVSDASVVVDGGLPHYDGGGLLGGSILDGSGEVDVSVAGTNVGTADGRDVEWGDVQVVANGKPVTGLAAFCARDAFGVKLVGEEIDLAVGDDVTVTFADRSP